MRWSRRRAWSDPSLAILLAAGLTGLWNGQRPAGPKTQALVDLARSSCRSLAEGSAAPTKVADGAHELDRWSWLVLKGLVDGGDHCGRQIRAAP